MTTDEYEQIAGFEQFVATTLRILREQDGLIAEVEG